MIYAFRRTGSQNWRRVYPFPNLNLICIQSHNASRGIRGTKHCLGCFTSPASVISLVAVLWACTPKSRRTSRVPTQD
ncbi:hypothetical protein B0T17DRAFT_600142 [Bombardia bombarda]|uniref:Uncharacterized protein n=1 Tax=Bombardia bombarda TaxID=252184 RepID=A0AA39WTH3_9PEZI|nr:hypothetical protein B0T17DRAFT_600142 [Bombardia bombarda]